MQARGCGIRGSKLQEDLERHGRPLTVSAHGIGVWVKVNRYLAALMDTQREMRTLETFFSNLKATSE